MPPLSLDFCEPFGRGVLLLAAVLLLVGGGSDALAQDLDNGFYGKFGAGLSDYVGDLTKPGASVSQETGVDANVLKHFPLGATGELGYRFSPKWALALGGQAGSYSSVGDARPRADSYRRYTPYLVGRYTFGAPSQRVAFYLDAGLNVTVGGATDTKRGIGPSVGGGMDIRAGRAISIYVESRLNMTVPDEAVDGAGTGSFDAVNQPLGFGVTFSLTTPTAPELVALNVPSEVPVDTAVTFTATVNEDEAARPLDRQWTFGDGTEGAGSTVTHTYSRPGTYTVSVAARNEAGEATAATTITVTPAGKASSAPESPWVVSLSARSNPVSVGEPVQFNTIVEGDGPFTYQWTVGGETVERGPTPTFTFDRAGWHAVRVRVSNDAGSEVRTMRIHAERRAAGASRSAEARSGTWAIGVASMRNREGARAMAERYRDRVPDAPGAVRIVKSERGQGRLHRVVVGTYETEDAARQAREQYRQTLPSGAWVVRLN